MNKAQLFFLLILALFCLARPAYKLAILMKRVSDEGLSLIALYKKGYDWWVNTND